MESCSLILYVIIKSLLWTTLCNVIKHWKAAQMINHQLKQLAYHCAALPRCSWAYNDTTQQEEYHIQRAVCDKTIRHECSHYPQFIDRQEQLSQKQNNSTDDDYIKMCVIDSLTVRNTKETDEVKKKGMTLVRTVSSFFSFQMEPSTIIRSGVVLQLI